MSTIYNRLEPFLDGGSALIPEEPVRQLGLIPQHISMTNVGTINHEEREQQNLNFCIHDNNIIKLYSSQNAGRLKMLHDKNFGSLLFLQYLKPSFI